jgi:hypothetical protein
MIELQFFADINFQNFLDEVEQSTGEVPGEVDNSRRVLRLESEDYLRHEGALTELVNDYGGRVQHRKPA